jgi:hypothetical protein
MYDWIYHHIVNTEEFIILVGLVLPLILLPVFWFIFKNKKAHD